MLGCHCCASGDDVQGDGVTRMESDTGKAGVARLLTPKAWQSAVARCSWTVKLVKGEDHKLFGIDVDIDPEGVLSIAKEPRGGAALEWNNKAKNSGFQIGDIVEAVNGVKGDASELVQQIKESELIKLSMQRLVEFTITLRVEEGLGIKFKEERHRALVDEVILEGDVDVYNESCLAGLRVAPGNWLSSIDGRTTSPSELIQIASELEPGIVQLCFGRPSPD